MLEIFTLSLYTHCALNIIFINFNFLKNEKSTKTQHIVHIEGIFFIIFTFISLKIVTTTTASTREENLLRKVWRKTLRNRWPRGRETAAVFYFQFLCNDVYHRGVEFSFKTRIYVRTGYVIVCWTNFPYFLLVVLVLVELQYDPFKLQTTDTRKHKQMDTTAGPKISLRVYRVWIGGGQRRRR